ncbi:MAG: LpxD N-terminal domain-containing protein, partial [bacterium]
MSGVAPLDRAGPSHLSILSGAKYQTVFATTRAGVVLVDPEYRDAPGTPGARVIVKQPLEKLLSLLPRLYPEKASLPGIAPTARIGKGALLGDRVSVEDYAIVGARARLGDGAVIGS